MARQAKLASHGAFGDALIGEATSALATLQALIAHPALQGVPETSGLRGMVEQVGQRLSRGELLVVVAGEAGSGKSTFIDALIGDRRLGASLSNAAATTIIRNNAWYDYSAKFVGGRSEEFATRFPDRSDELSAALDELAQAVARAELVLTAAQSGQARAREQLDRAVAALTRCRRSLESSRSATAQAGAALDEASAAGERARNALASVERSIPPALRERPRWWALWSWFFLAWFLIVRRRAWKDWRSLEREHVGALALLPAAQQRAAGTEKDQRRAEAELEMLEAAERDALAQMTAAGGSLGRAEGELQLLQRAIGERRAELARAATERLDQFFAELRKLSEASTRGRQLVEIEIDYPARRLPEDVTLVDSPGITSQDEARRARAWEVIRERADGCILIAELDRAVSQSTKRFLLQMREVVPHVLLVLTKMDQAFLDAMRRGGSEPWEQVEQARRIGTRRFAREIGRAPDEVLSIAIAAQAALDDPQSGLARRFDLEVEKLFQLLRHERALILGTRAAGVVRRCIAETSEAEQRAERALSERIAALEADRLPNPDEFRQTLLQAASDELDRAALRAIELAATSIDEGFRMLRAQSVQQLSGAGSGKALLERAARCELELAGGLPQVAADSVRTLE
jgi:hypothetical protein